eukprot:3692427-Prymnesium_polylepis.1
MHSAPWRRSRTPANLHAGPRDPKPNVPPENSGDKPAKIPQKKGRVPPYRQATSLSGQKRASSVRLGAPAHVIGQKIWPRISM